MINKMHSVWMLSRIVWKHEMQQIGLSLGGWRHQELQESYNQQWILMVNLDWNRIESTKCLWSRTSRRWWKNMLCNGNRGWRQNVIWIFEFRWTHYWGNILHHFNLSMLLLRCQRLILINSICGTNFGCWGRLCNLIAVIWTIPTYHQWK